MKLSLQSEDDIQILEVQGSVDSQNLLVLKAGITKLIKNGKNRIIVKLGEGAESLPNDVIREIAILDLYAKELAGNIAIVCGNENVKQNIINFSKPPVITMFTDVKAAIGFFKTPKTEKLELDPKTKSEGVLAKEKEIEALKAQLAMQSPEELQRLRAEKADFAAKNKLLEEQLHDLIKQRRTPPGVEAFEQKLFILEDSVGKLTEQLQKAK